MAEDWPQPTRAQEMSEMKHPDGLVWRGPVSTLTTADLYTELRRRSCVIDFEARIAELTAQRDAAVHALTAMSAARNQAADERDEAKEAWSRAATERDEAQDLAAHNEMLRDMAEKRVKELEADYADLLDRNEGLEDDLDSAVEVAWKHGAHEWVRLNYSFLYRRLALHSPRATAALACSPASRGSEAPAAVSDALSGSAALSRAMGAPALAGPAAWMGDD